MRKIPFVNPRPLLRLPVTAILPNPAQPRSRFDEAALQSLAESIRENGILQPLSVRRSAGGYTLISGERRLRAARMAGLDRVPCLLLRASDQNAAVMALLENLQREDLDCLEEARGISDLIHVWGVPREDAAARLGMASSTLSNKLRLLKLTPWQQDRIRAARLSERHARALLRVEDPALRDDLLLKIIANDLTVADAERLIRDALSPPADKPPIPCRKALVGDLRLVANTIEHAVSAMQRSGVDAKAEKTETEQFIQYTIRITKVKEEPISSRLVELG